ncbi:MAG: FAD-dependent oxidoreductase, partial [Planctomycetota bacterium]
MPEPNTAWRCRVCGYVHRGPEPPERCPVCDAPREAFEVLEQGAADVPEAEKAERVAIIGAGAAGIAAAESLRRAAPRTEIIVISKETEHPYYRLNLTRYLAGEVERDELPMHPASWYEEQNIELLLGKEAARIDLDDHVVELSDGDRVPYDKLLLAAGAHPYVPSIPGADCNGVTSVRTVHDADSILEACRAGARCVCIGGGILGLETAGALARRGVDVTLLERHQWLMPRQLNPKAGEILSGYVNRLGIKLLREASTQEIVGDTAVRGVRLEDGRDIPAELVVIATGVRPNSSLAQESGLSVNRGVVVDNYLRASHPDVLAAGDVAEHEGVIHGLWTVSRAQGAIAGMNLAGTATEFGGLPRFNTLKVLGLELASIGQIMPEEDRDQVFEQEA